ncbi:leucine-rich repeat-containing protein 37A-like [Crotalus adamanteus]|uniref:Leucine-rich repeat-containing protein 37A-like n=1 Tax=Crotalus adamanteus TaxID=8729 RepID=A0AAW1B440_CROAD
MNKRVWWAYPWTEYLILKNNHLHRLDNTSLDGLLSLTHLNVSRPLRKMHLSLFHSCNLLFCLGKCPAAFAKIRIPLKPHLIPSSWIAPIDVSQTLLIMRKRNFGEPCKMK